MDESLFTTRQLTEYREWPDGRKGCLFYLQGYPYMLYSSEAIVLIDSPVRIYDKVGPYDNLHESELNELKMNSRDAFIIEGYGAHIIAWLVAHNGKMEEFDNQKEWEHYYAQRRSGEFINEGKGNFFQNECLCLMRKNDVYIVELLTLLVPPNEAIDLESTVKEIGNAIGYILYEPLVKWLSNLDAQFDEIIPRITLRDNMGELYNAYYNPYRQIFCASQNADGQLYLEVCGFQAALMNFALANYVYTDFERHANEEQMMQSIENLINRLWPYTTPEDRTLDYEEIKSEMNFAHFDVQGVIDTYVGKVLQNLCSLSEKKVRLGIMDEDRQKQKAIRQLFEQEWTYAQYNPFLPFMKKTHSMRLKTIVNYFFDYLLDLLEDSPKDYEACYKLMHSNTPNTSDIPPVKTNDTSSSELENNLPPKDKYIELVIWLKKEKELGRDYFAEAGKNRSKMCRNLKKIIGWEPKANSLGKQWNT